MFGDQIRSCTMRGEVGGEYWEYSLGELARVIGVAVSCRKQSTDNDVSGPLFSLFFFSTIFHSPLREGVAGGERVPPAPLGWCLS